MTYWPPQISTLTWLMLTIVVVGNTHARRQPPELNVALKAQDWRKAEIIHRRLIHEASGRDVYWAKIKASKFALETATRLVLKYQFQDAHHFCEIATKDDLGIDSYLKAAQTRQVALTDLLNTNQTVDDLVRFADHYWASAPVFTGAEEAIRFIEELLHRHPNLHKTDPDIHKRAIASLRKNLKAVLARTSQSDAREKLAHWETVTLSVHVDDADLCCQILIQQGILAAKNKNHSLAESKFRRALEHYPTSAWSSSATFNLGNALKDQGRTQEAITAYQELIHSTPRLLPKPVKVFHQSSDNHSSAYWQIGICQLTMNNPTAALAAFQASAKVSPPFAGCGNAFAEIRYRQAFHEAACHEYLGDYRAAAISYWQLAMNDRGLILSGDSRHLERLIIMYKVADQMEAVRHLVGVIEAQQQIWSKTQSISKEDLTRITARTDVGKLRQYLAIEEEGRTGQIKTLIKRLETLKAPDSFWDLKRTYGAWLAFEIAYQLKRNADSATPLLITQLEGIEHPRNYWLHYALGHCATPDGIDFLSKKLAETKNYNVAAKLALGLIFAGDLGQERLESLDKPEAPSNLRLIIQRWRDGEFGVRPKGLQFPTPTTVNDLPTSVIEFDQHAAYAAKLQKKQLTADLTTPEKSIATFIRAVQRQDRQIYDFTHNGEDMWNRFYKTGSQKDDFDRPLILNFEIMKVDTTSSGADITLDLSISGKTSRIVLSLEKRAIGWVIVGAKE